MTEETEWQKFLRNHQEEVGVMRTVAVRMEREGNTEDAARVRQMIAAWERIAAHIREQTGLDESLN